jgi:hypothetical protein
LAVEVVEEGDWDEQCDHQPSAAAD